MPHYDYSCNICGCKFDIYKKYADNYLVRCPKCKDTDVQQAYKVNLQTYPVRNVKATMNGETLWEA